GLHSDQRRVAIVGHLGFGEMGEAGGAAGAEILDHPVEQFGELRIRERRLGRARDLYEEASTLRRAGERNERLLDGRHPAWLTRTVRSVTTHALEHVVDARLVSQHGVAGNAECKRRDIA